MKHLLEKNSTCKSCETLKVSENILVKDKIYKIKRMNTPTRPTENDVIYSCLINKIKARFKRAFSTQERT